MAGHGVEAPPGREGKGFVGLHGPWSENNRPAKVEHGVAYGGERVTALGFLYMFPNVLCRYHGSVIPTVWLEIVLAVLMGFLPLWVLDDLDKDGLPDEESSIVGHQVCRRPPCHSARRTNPCPRCARVQTMENRSATGSPYFAATLGGIMPTNSCGAAPLRASRLAGCYCR